MVRRRTSIAALVGAITVFSPLAPCWARGFAGGHGGGRGGGFGALPGGGGLPGLAAGGGMAAGGGLRGGNFGAEGLTAAGIGGRAGGFAPGGFAGGFGGSLGAGGLGGAGLGAYGSTGARGIGGVPLAGLAGGGAAGLGPYGDGNAARLAALRGGPMVGAAGGYGPRPLAAGAGGLGAGPLAAGGGGPLTAGRLGGFLGLPSDEGLHNLAGNAAGVPRPSILDVDHGAVAGPFGGYAAGTTVTGPRGNEVGRGAAVRPYGGVTAGRFAAGAAGGYAAGFAHVAPSARYATAAAVRHGFAGYGIYGRDWRAAHPAAWYAAGWADGSAWNAATWNVLDVWLYESAIQPVYYDYGQTVTYQDDSVNVNGQDAGTPAEYSQQATDLAIAGAEAEAPADGEWLPLGVFALTKTGQTQSDVVLQLAVNKQGVIRGNSTDTKTGQTQMVQGSVDKQAQRVAFTVGDNSSTVVETGLYNLTKAEAPVLIHFGGDRTEQWLLVRLQNQDASAPQQ